MPTNESESIKPLKVSHFSGRRFRRGELSATESLLGFLRLEMEWTFSAGKAKAAAMHARRARPRGKRAMFRVSLFPRLRQTNP